MSSTTHRSPRVVILGSWPPLPGISSYVHSLAGGLAKKTPVRILTFRHMYPAFLYPGGSPPTDQTFPPDPPGVTVDRVLRWYHPLGWIYRGLTTPADIVHVQFWSLPVAPVWWVLMLLFRLRGIPVVTTVHNIAGHESKRSFRFATNRLIALSNFIITHLADPPADFVKFVRRQTGRDPGHVPHGLLDLYRQAPQKLDPPILAKGEKGILFFGAIRPYKGLDILLEAFEIVQKHLPTARLVIVGRPWEPWDRYARQIESQSSRDRVIVRLGYIPTNEVAGYFDTCEIVVAPYLQFNSQSGAALSAIGMGKPLIVTQVGGLPELQPIADYVIPPGNPRLLADAILRALGDRQELDRLADASRQVADRMNWDHIADETSKIYESLLFRAVTES